MPVHGVAPFIKFALESLERQTGANLEILCVDDGIREPTLQFIKDFSVRHGRVRLIQNQGAGIVDALNTGLTFARGGYVARMDSDDVCLADRFSTQVAFLDAHSEIGVLGTQARLIDSKGGVLRNLHVPVGVDRVHAALQVSCALIHPTVMMRRSVVCEAGGYRRGFDGAEDYELWLRLRGRTKLDNLAQPFLLYRRHDGQVTLRRQFHQARLAAIALAADRLKSVELDLLTLPGHHKNWRNLFAETSTTAVSDVCSYTACFLADNGGTLRRSGARYLRKVCQSSILLGSSEQQNRLVLACVRHQVLLARSGRLGESLLAFAADLLRWRAKLVCAYFLQASSLWRSRAWT